MRHLTIRAIGGKIIHLMKNMELTLSEEKNWRKVGGANIKNAV